MAAKRFASAARRARAAAAEALAVSKGAAKTLARVAGKAIKIVAPVLIYDAWSRSGFAAAIDTAIDVSPAGDVMTIREGIGAAADAADALLKANDAINEKMRDVHNSPLPNMTKMRIPDRPLTIWDSRRLLEGP